MTTDDKNNSPDRFLEIESVKDECAFDPKSERVVIVGTTPLGISPAFDQLNWKEDPYQHIAMVSQADIDENLESFFKRTEGTKIDNLLKDDKVKFMEHLSTPIKPNLEAMAAVAEVTAEIPGVISGMRDIDLLIKNIQDRGLSASNVKVGDLYSTLLEKINEDWLNSTIPLPKSTTELLNGGIRVGEMLVFNSSFLGRNPSLSHKSNIQMYHMSKVLEQGGTVAIGEGDLSNHFDDRIASHLTSMSFNSFGHHSGKVLMNKETLEKALQKRMEEIHIVARQSGKTELVFDSFVRLLNKLSTHYNETPTTDEGAIVEKVTHKTKSYYNRKVKKDVKLSPLLKGLVKLQEI